MKKRIKIIFGCILSVILSICPVYGAEMTAMQDFSELPQAISQQPKNGVDKIVEGSNSQIESGEENHVQGDLDQEEPQSGNHVQDDLDQVEPQSENPVQDNIAQEEPRKSRTAAAAQLMIQVDGKEQSATVRLLPEGLSGTENTILFPTWSEAGGQDDIRWYGGSKQADGSWQAEIPILNHRMSGIYHTHAYVQNPDGSLYFINRAVFSIQAPKAEITLGNVDEESGVFSVRISNLNTVSPVQSVLVPVWHEADQSDIYWYGAKKQGDGSYLIKTELKNHAFHTGVYQVHTYVQTDNGILTCVGTNQTEVQVTSRATAVVDQDEKMVHVTLETTAYNAVDQVIFPTWSEAGGQDDMGWYGGNRGADGRWSIDIPIINHKTAGNYLTHIYASVGGKLQYLTKVDFTIHQPTAVVSIGEPDGKDGSFTVRITDVECKSGVQYVWVPIWSEANQSDLNWYLGARQFDGSYVVQVKIKNHKYHAGEYQIHTYIQSGNGLMTCVNKGRTNIDLKIDAQANVSADEKSVTVVLNPVGMFDDSAGVLFPTWSEDGGQDDLRWYGGHKNSSGQWTAQIDISNHKTAGAYFTHIYVQKQDGALQYVAKADYTIHASEGSVTLDAPDHNQGTLRVKISRVFAASGVDAVLVPVWSEPDQSDICWYEARKNGSDTYEVTVNINRHLYHAGTYYVHAYVRSKSGIMSSIFAGSTVMNSSQTLTDSNRIAKLSAASNCSCLVTVTRENNGVRMKYYEKENGTWYRKIDTDAQIGTRGFSAHPTEGSYTTPLGAFDFGIAFGNKPNPGTALSWVDVNPYHWWIDDPASSHYNTMVDTRLVQKDWRSGEHLSTIVPAYNYAVNIEVNPRCEQNSCSAIFLHAKGYGSSTAGCIAIDESIMVYLLRHMRSGAKIVLANNSTELMNY